MMYDSQDWLVTGIKELTSKRRLIYINYEPAFVLYTGEVRQYHIAEGTSIEGDAYREILEELLVKRAKVRAMNLLKSKDYAEQELRRKLAQGYYPEQIIDEAIAYVKGYHYIDDDRYISNYLSSQSSHKSKRQMIQFLSGKGISKEKIEAAFNEFYEENSDAELNTCVYQMQKKMNHLTEISYEEKQKLMNFFYRKGFNTDIIRKALDIVFNERYNN